MTYLKRIAALGIILVSTLGAAFAADDHPAIRNALNSIIPGSAPDKITASPIPGLFEVTFGPQLFYISEDGRYMVQGHMFDVTSRTNLTEVRQGELRKVALDKIGEENMLIFAAEKPKHTITVFTDIDCGYCRKLHDEIKQTNALGITVRYLFFPRSGMNTDSYYKSETVWCSDNRQTAMTEAKAGKDLPRKTCKNPIAQHMALVETLGLQGTPAIILEDGRMIPGYMPSKQIEAVLEGKMQP